MTWLGLILVILTRLKDAEARILFKLGWATRKIKLSLSRCTTALKSRLSAESGTGLDPAPSVSAAPTSTPKMKEHPDPLRCPPVGFPGSMPRDDHFLRGFFQQP